MEEINSLQTLTPIKESDIKVYDETLDYILNNVDLKNIAIAGPYSSGKSSVLETYKENNKENKFLHISLAHFEITEKDKVNNREGYDEKSLEGKMLNQLIHQVDPEKIPQTHFKIKREVPTKNIRNASFCITILIILTLYLFKFNDWIAFVNNFSDTWFKTMLTYTFNKELLFFAGAALVVFIGYCIFRLLKEQYEKIIFKKIAIQGNEIALFEKDNDSYFDKYLNEILYIFKNADIDVFVFEDIDRYNSIYIFEKLREINYLVNKKSNKVIRFFYMLRDDIFISKDRTKFFDFILPIVPILDASNSYDQFIAHFEKGGLYGRFEDKFLQGLSLYIDDMRILKNIYNEFIIYKGRIQSIELDDNKLLALISYKNIFPKDFSELQLGRGVVYSIFDSKEYIINKRVKEIESSIEEKKIQIKEIEDEMLKNIDELDSVFINFANTRLTIDGKNEDKYETRVELIRAIKNSKKIHDRNSLFDKSKYFDKLSNNTEYTKRKAAIEQKVENKAEELKREINKLENTKIQLENQKLKNLITKANINEIFYTQTTKMEMGKDNFKEIQCNHYFPLIVYLLRNGYIDETYQDYLTYFYENSLSISDKNFLRSVVDEVPKDFSYKLKNPELIISRLNESDFNKEEILNFDLLTNLINTNHSYCKLFLDQLKDKKRFDFIWKYYTLEKEKQAFIKELNKKWHMIWINILDNKDISEDQKMKYLIDTLYYSYEQDILNLNIDNCLTDYISTNESFLDINEPKIENIISGLKLLKVRFKRIDYNSANQSLFKEVYESNLYEINYDMISLIIKEIYKEPISENYKHKNYTIIASKPNEPLKLYIDENINLYMDVILKNCDGKITDTEPNVLSLLNNRVINFDKKINYLDYLETIINDINEIEEVDWEEFLKRETVKYTPDNILSYYLYYGELNETLISFINCSNDIIKFDYKEISKKYPKENISSFYLSIIQCNNLSDDRYKMILSHFNSGYDEFVFKDIHESKVDILINQRIIFMNKDNLLFMRKNYPSNKISYICSNIAKYVEIMEEEKDIFLPEEALELLSEDISDENKIKLLKNISGEISLANKHYSEAIEIYILEHNFDIKDIPYLLKSYDNKSMKIKSLIQNICLQNVSIITAEKYKIPIDVLTNLLSSSEVKEDSRNSLFINNLPSLQESEIKRVFQILSLKNYLGLLEGKRPLFEKTEYNKQVLSILKSKGMISRYKVDKKESDYYRAFGRRLRLV